MLEYDDKLSCGRAMMCILLASIVSGCAANRMVPGLQKDELVRRDLLVGEELANSFEPHLAILHNLEISADLNKLAKKLMEAASEPDITKANVFLIRNVDNQWLCFGLPGSRIYLSLALLRELNYENEYAALLAIEMAHIQNKNVLKKLIVKMSVKELNIAEGHEDLYSSIKDLPVLLSGWELHRSDYFGSNGIFSFSDQVELDAIEVAVRILYRSGYDSRGIVTLYQIYASHLDHSPYPKALIEHLIERSRREIASFSPIRNPIVKTRDFLVMQKRIKSL